jgi:hypothetical protein
MHKIYLIENGHKNASANFADAKVRKNFQTDQQ